MTGQDSCSTASMNPIRTILVPIDVGEPSEAALVYAADLAQSLGAALHVLHAYQLPVIGFPDGVVVPDAGWATRLSVSSQRFLDDAVAKVGKRNVAITPHLKEGDPRDAILQTAREIGAQLIVLGTHGRGGIARALIGSVAERVVRTADVPVLTVHGIRAMA